MEAWVAAELLTGTSHGWRVFVCSEVIILTPAVHRTIFRSSTVRWALSALHVTIRSLVETRSASYKQNVLQFCNHFENVCLKICKINFRMLGHAFTIKIKFFLPAFIEAKNKAQCSVSTYTFEFAPNVKGKKTPTRFRLFWHESVMKFPAHVLAAFFGIGIFGEKIQQGHVDMEPLPVQTRCRVQAVCPAVTLALRVRAIEFILSLLFINYCIIFHLNNFCFT